MGHVWLVLVEPSCQSQGSWEQYESNDMTIQNKCPVNRHLIDHILVINYIVNEFSNFNG
jgi:hypothetical protein